MQPEVRKVLANKQITDDHIESKMAEEQYCQNDSCYNYGGKVDRCHEDCQNGGYHLEQMEEIGRTRLELNDVCYINGKFERVPYFVFQVILT